MEAHEKAVYLQLAGDDDEARRDELAEELTEGLTDPLAKARRFYDYVTTNVRYSYMRSYFCLESISDGCARNLVGDCGVQVLMFVTLCRCVGIPAVFHGAVSAIYRKRIAGQKHSSHR